MAHYKGPASESQRVMQLQKKRERHQEEIEIKKRKLADELKVNKMEAKFSAHYDAVENELKSSTVGLVTAEEMKNIQEKAVMDREKQLARKNQDELNILRKEEKAREKARQKQKQKIKKLSFGDEEGKLFYIHTNLVSYQEPKLLNMTKFPPSFLRRRRRSRC